MIASHNKIKGKNHNLRFNNNSKNHYIKNTKNTHTTTHLKTPINTYVSTHTNTHSSAHPNTSINTLVDSSDYSNKQRNNSKQKQEQEPKVSIIIPAYNEEKTIARTIKSILNQTYKNYEILVVNNNSKDKTEEIAKRYVRVITEKQQGYIPTVISGIKHTTGKIISICDADSYYPKKWLEKMLKSFNKKKVVGVYGSARFYDTNIFLSYISYLIYSTFLIISRVLGVDNAAGFNFLFSRKAYEKSKGYNINWKWASPDIELAQRLKKYGKLKLRLTYVYTSSRRFKKSGFIKTSLMFLKAWYSMLKKKAPNISYKEYNAQRK
ncbi:MAG: glycosyltransferase [Nitrospiraceae bacterium]|nr:glycosyltransferase [Nitrospiraceae bacterium]